MSEDIQNDIIKRKSRKALIVGMVTAFIAFVILGGVFGLGMWLGGKDCRDGASESEHKHVLNHGDRKTLTLPGGETMTMIYVAPGSFMMGSPRSEEGHDDDETQHHVTLTKGYWLGETEVTQAQWGSVMGNNPSYFKGMSRPVERVSWEDCQAFIANVNREVRRQFGGDARLPTEAEWEYACRAGSIGNYAGTGELNDMGWYCDNSEAKTHKVKGKKANAWGFYDMHGNVWEWCQDWYGTYPSGAVTDPTGSASGDGWVLRGGSWYSAGDCRSANRSGDRPGSRNGSYGFRLCCFVGPRD
jgi:formylglycine-generating enzyme required for sulfatase activity